MKNWLRKRKAAPTPDAPARAANAAGGTGARPDASGADALLRRLEWTVLRRLDGLLQGDWRTLMRGSGIDLADLREYQLHDDVRHIDWNVTARLDMPHVRVFTEDRDMTAWFLLDLSPSVDFGSGEQRKRDASAAFAAVIARLLTRRGNRVGALLYGAGVDEVIPAGSGRVQVLRLLHAMARRAGTADAAAPRRESGHTTRLAELLRAADAQIRRRSAVFVVSDFISEPGWETALGRLAQRHDVVAVRLLDPLELELPDLGLLPVRDAETGEQIMVDFSDAGFRHRFARLAAQREADLRAALAAAGVDTLELATTDDLAQAVLRFVDLRRRRARQSGAAGTHLHAHLHTHGGAAPAAA